MQTTRTLFTAGTANKAQAGMHSCQPGDPKSNPQRTANIRLTLLLLLTFGLPVSRLHADNSAWVVKDITAATKGEVGGEWTAKSVQRWHNVTGTGTTLSKRSITRPGKEHQIVEVVGEFSPPGNSGAWVRLDDILLTAPPPRGREQVWTGRKQVSRLGLFHNGVCTYSDLDYVRYLGADRFGPLQAASGTMTLLHLDGEVVGDIQFSIEKDDESGKVLISKPARLCLAFIVPQSIVRTPSLHFAGTVLTVSVTQQPTETKPDSTMPVPVGPRTKEELASDPRYDDTTPYLTGEEIPKFIESMKQDRDAILTFARWKEGRGPRRTSPDLTPSRHTAGECVSYRPRGPRRAACRHHPREEPYALMSEPTDPGGRYQATGIPAETGWSGSVKSVTDSEPRMEILVPQGARGAYATAQSLLV